MSAYDFIVVGGGQNALTAAAYLAKGGSSVALLEQHDHIGGGCVSREVTLPGFKHDTHGTNAFLIKANPLIKNDELGLLSRFGMAYVKTDKAYHGSFFADGSVVEVYTDLDKTCEAIASLSPADAEAYRQFGMEAARYVDLLSWGMFAPAANPATFVEVLKQSEQGRFMLALMNKSAWELICETFQDKRVRTHLFRKTSEMMISPEVNGTAFAMFMIVGFSHRYTSGSVVGGSQTLSDSLGRCLQHYGGEIYTATQVVKLEQSGSRIAAVHTESGDVYNARQAVIAAIPPWQLHRFIDGFDPKLTAAAEATPPSDFGVYLHSIALNNNVQLNYPQHYGTIQINQFCSAYTDSIVQCYRGIKAGKVPLLDIDSCGDGFYANAICATILDPSRAPAGKGTLYLYHMVPFKPDGDLNNWDQLKQPFGEALLKGAQQFISNLDDSNILAVYSETPKDMAAYSPSFRNGDVMGAGTYAEQFLGGRPCKEFADFTVPGIQGLYLTGPFMHPGGGICGGGRAVAMKAMVDLGLNLDTAFTYY